MCTRLSKTAVASPRRAPSSRTPGAVCRSPIPGRGLRAALWGLPMAVVAIALLALPLSGLAQSPKASASAAGPASADAAPDEAAADAAVDSGAAEAQDPGVAALREKTRQIDALLAGTLEASVDAAALFDVVLDDREAVALEARRLGALVSAVDEALARADAGVDAGLGAAARAATRQFPPPRRPDGPDAGEEGAETDAAAAGPDDDTIEVSDELWEARIALDRARLAFYELAAAARRDSARRPRRARAAERAGGAAAGALRCGPQGARGRSRTRKGPRGCAGCTHGGYAPGGRGARAAARHQEAAGGVREGAHPS